MQRIDVPALASALGDVEFTNALELYVFRRQITAAEARKVHAHMREDIRAGLIAVSPISPEVFALSLRFVERWTAKLGVRTLDILHVATALELGAEHFETFDRRQKTLAEAIGLKVQ